MLSIYKRVAAGVYTPFALDEETTDLLPIIITQDGTLGGSYVTKLYVRNDDPDEYYTNIQVVPYSKISPSRVDGTSTGYGVKLYTGDDQPTEGEWEDTDYANTISLSNIGTASVGDTSTYLPFWARFECPAGVLADNIESVVIRASFKANTVS